MNSLPPPVETSPSRVFLASVACVAAVILVLEIALTRVFGTVLRYHFAFLVISIALCGLGLGGYAMQLVRSRFNPDLAKLAAIFALSVGASLFVLTRLVFPTAPEAVWLSSLVILVPFLFGGAWLAEAFARFPAWSGRIYAWDLAGAACAAVGTVWILGRMSAGSAILLAAVVGALPAVILGRRANWASVSPLVLAALWIVSARSGLFETTVLPPKTDADGLSLADRGTTQPLFTELGTPNNQSKIVETRWNAFARTDIVDDPLSPGGYLLYTNGNVPTNMMRWDGNLASIEPMARDFALSDWCFSIAPLKKADSRVFSIGPGGGLDALFALRYGAKRFDGAEINPSIVQIMRDYRKWNGGIYQRPDVRVQTADGRAFAREALNKGTRYDLIFSALTKTATAGQGMALLESFIYTQDAFDEYWQLLKPDGQATIVLDNPLLLARFTATWLQVLADKGIDNKSAMQHITIAHDPRPGPYVFALVVQKTPFAGKQSETVNNAANSRQLTSVWVPQQAALSSFGPYPQLGDGTLSAANFIGEFRSGKPQFGGQALDISPCPDDRPFVLDLSLETLPVFKQLAAFATLLAVSLSFVGLALPSRQTRKATAASTSEGDDAEIAPHIATIPAETSASTSTRFGARDAAWIGYFAALGVGFMLVEIPLAQKLILPLGYPTLALAVILFSILLGGGAGAWFSQRVALNKLANWAAVCALGVAILGALSAQIVARLAPQMAGWSLESRCVIVALLLLPLGFLLGTPFPSGMRLFARRREGSLPLVWGLNGVASVVGSLLAAMGGKNFGFAQTLLFGAGIYVLAALLVGSLGRDE